MSDSEDNEDYSSYTGSEDVSDYETSSAHTGTETESDDEYESNDSEKPPPPKPSKKVTTKVEQTSETNKNREKRREIDENEPFKWGFTLNEVYRSAVRFYKDKEGKAFNLAYTDKVKLAALTKQVAYGPCVKCKKKQEIGYFDWFGNDRLKCWMELDNMKKTDAMADLVHLVDKTIPVFSPYMVALQKEREEKERIKREEEERIRVEELRKKEEEERKIREEEERIRKEEEERKQKELEAQQEAENAAEREKQKIIAGLNAQTNAQFTSYAAQQHPGDRDAQTKLIEHLQDQHYDQYMAQLSECNENDPVPIPVQTTIGTKEIRIEPPSMWTRPQIRELKDQLRKDSESVLTVGRGEVVTVRVPTHEEGAYLFWEFASDSYDLGFGVYFEWSNVKTNQVSVAVNESSDDEEYQESDDEEEGTTTHGDPEKGTGRRSNRPPTDEIVPVYRRDCHIQVHAGSHQYPGSGVYLLKFDNSYSLWRSKTLYYRVYYTR